MTISSDLPADASAPNPPPLHVHLQSQVSGTSSAARRAEKPSSPCPRCHSSDTKFCYFNNHNVKQPRHFCRSCQRYWTAGGCLRNLPVGAGRRKNKRSRQQQHEVVDEDLDLGTVDYDVGARATTADLDLTMLSMSSSSSPLPLPLPPLPRSRANNLCHANAKNNEASFPSVLHGSCAKKSCVGTHAAGQAMTIPPVQLYEDDLPFRRHAAPSELDASTENQALKVPLPTTCKSTTETQPRPAPSSDTGFSFPVWNQCSSPLLQQQQWLHHMQPSAGAALPPDATMLAAWAAAAAFWQFPFLFSPFGGGWPPTLNPWNAPLTAGHYVVDPRSSSSSSSVPAPHHPLPSALEGREPLCVPKTLKVGDPEEVTHSSILTVLGLSSSATGGLLGASRNQRTEESQQKGAQTLPQSSLHLQKLLLHNNPAAQARSLVFQEKG